MATTNTTEKKRYLAAQLGMDAKGNPHAFHVEGYISKPAYFKTGTDDKKSYLGTSIGIAMSPERMMALADGTFDKALDYGEDNGFISLNLFGKEAEAFSKVCAVGIRVAVSGNLEWNEYPLKNGNTGKDLRILVNNLVVMGGKNSDATIASDVGVATRIYTGSDGVQRSVPTVELMSGVVVNVRDLAFGGKDNKAYLSFGVKTAMPAEKICDLATGTFDSKKDYDTKKRIVNVTVFGGTAEALSKVIRDGALVVCTGAVEAREYNGNTSYQMRAQVCSVMKYAPLAEGGATASAPSGTAAAASAPDANYSSDFFTVDDLDDNDLPF